MPVPVDVEPGWLSLLVPSFVSAALASVGTYFAANRQQVIDSKITKERHEARMTAIEVQQKRHEDDCVERNRKMDAYIAGQSHSNAELQRQIQAVQLVQAEQATHDDIRKLIAAVERNTRR